MFKCHGHAQTIIHVSKIDEKLAAAVAAVAAADTIFGCFSTLLNDAN